MDKKELAAFIARGKAKRKKVCCASMKITREQGIYILYQLKLKNKSCASIARDMGCSRMIVQQVVAGQRHSKKIEHAVAAALGCKSWNALVQQLRAKDSARRKI